ncbi:MAG TPA: hypothetical protein VMX17_14100 [Candidatus Glassbacteria bacterium]|nr:hypothetical protein [Candidatus Glassbacteria bacterium]
MTIESKEFFASVIKYILASQTKIKVQDNYSEICKITENAFGSVCLDGGVYIDWVKENRKMGLKEEPMKVSRYYVYTIVSDGSYSFTNPPDYWDMPIGNNGGEFDRTSEAIAAAIRFIIDYRIENYVRSEIDEQDVPAW